MSRRKKVDDTKLMEERRQRELEAVPSDGS
jgi:hypothetical protein